MTFDLGFPDLVLLCNLIVTLSSIELTLNFEMDRSCLSSDCNNEDRRKVMTTLFYEQALPLITNMFGSHTNMRFVTIYYSDHDNSISQPNWTKQIELFWQVIFLHHSLQFVEISY